MLQELKRCHCPTLVDVGCGSGVLALAGLKLGVKWAVALDLSPQALIATRNNAEINQLQSRLTMVRGSTESVAGSFDLVLANLPTPVLKAKLAELVRLSADSATLVLSGFQDVDRLALEKEMVHLGLTPVQWLSGDLSFNGVPPSGSYTWMAVLARRKECGGRDDYPPPMPNC
jgi:ribosomal protein L11 methyltransferase